MINKALLPLVTGASIPGNPDQAGELPDAALRCSEVILQPGNRSAITFRDDAVVGTDKVDSQTAALQISTNGFG